MSEGCTLCDLETPDPPVTDPDVEGEYCCRGCLEVVRTLGDGDPEAVSADDLDGGSEAQGLDAPDEAARTFLSVDGMHCSTCEAFLESVLADEDGVYDAEANYPADLVRVAYDPDVVDETALPGVVTGLGYRATLSGDAVDEAAAGADAGTGRLDEDSASRLLVGGFFGMMAMGYYVLFLYPHYLGFAVGTHFVDLEGGAGTYLLWNIWLFASVVLGYTGKPILRGAYVSLRAGLPNMDLLVSLAATTAWAYSTLVLLTGGVEIYFDVTIAVVLVVTLGERYEKRVKRDAAGRLTDLTENRVTRARRLVGPAAADPAEVLDAADPAVEELAVSTLSPGDLVLVEPGERVPVDGTVEAGRAAVDESLLTGESRPVPRGPGAEAVGGSLVTDGRLIVRVGEDAESTLDRVVTLLWDVQSSGHGAQRLADKLATVFVPLVVVLAAVAFAWHLLTGATLTAALLTALTVLVVSCPCALGLATPLAYASGIRAALDRNVVVTDGSLFERATEVDTVVFDKTGTLTTGAMRVQAVLAADGTAWSTGGPDARADGGTLAREDGDPSADPTADALARAAAVESRADHPVARAVVAAAESHRLAVDRDVTDFERVPGRGVRAVVDGEAVVVGSRDLLAEAGVEVPEGLSARADDAENDGQVPVFVAVSGTVEALLLAGDDPREGWREVVADLAEDVGSVVVLTGDSEGAARRFAEADGVDRVFAGVRPEAKAEVVARLRQDGPVAMVGDGSNDAPALATADVGIAMAEGTRLAADAADAVVLDGDLRAVPRAFALTAATRRRVRENLGWAFLYNAVAVPLALLGLLNPLFAALAMSASSLLVVGNSARDFGTDADRSSNDGKN